MCRGWAGSYWSSCGLGAWLLLLGKQCPGRFGFERFREQEPLPEFASDGDEALALRRGLDSLRDHHEAEMLRQVNDRAHDLQIGAARTHAVHEGLVDLDALQGEARQIAQGRIARAEIVHM